MSYGRKRGGPFPYPGRAGRSAFALALLALSGCASRKYVVRENQIDFGSEPDFYLILNEEAGRVRYRYFSNPFDYGKNGGGRSKEDYVLEVPAKSRST